MTNARADARSTSWTWIAAEIGNQQRKAEGLWVEVHFCLIRTDLTDIEPAISTAAAIRRWSQSVFDTRVAEFLKS